MTIGFAVWGSAERMVASEFSLEALRVRGCAIAAMVAALSLIVTPFVLWVLIQEGFPESLSPRDDRALSAFLLYALIIGAAITFTSFFYAGYQKGTRSRLLFGVASGALIVAYAVVVLDTSGIGSVLADIGLRVDMTYAALTLMYASAMLMLVVGAEYISLRGERKDSGSSASPAREGV